MHWLIPLRRHRKVQQNPMVFVSVQSAWKKGPLVLDGYTYCSSTCLSADTCGSNNRLYHNFHDNLPGRDSSIHFLEMERYSRTIYVG